VKKAAELFQQQGNQAKYQSTIKYLETVTRMAQFWSIISLFVEIIGYGAWIVIIVNSFRIVIYLRGANGYLIRGSAYSKLKQYQLSLNDYNKAIEINPQFVEAYVRQGIVHLQINQPDKAKIALKKAAKIFQQDSDPTKYQEIIKAIHELDKYTNKNNRRS
jgi:tetratricopeptide (TPR) repeat protein